jgi:CelD/BcsL family acetyltransferase involved in cellulose biosynthesis
MKLQPRSRSLNGSAELDGSLSGDWSGLAARSRNIFGTWEWATLWWKHFGNNRPLFVSTPRSSNGTPLAIVPLYSWSGPPLRVVRFVGHSVADELGPICATEDRGEMTSALSHALGEVPWGWDIFLGDHFFGDAPWSTEMDAMQLRQTSSPVLRIEGRDWSGFLSTKSANFRRAVVRYERALRKEYKVRFRLCDDPARLSDDLDTLFALHRARWRGRETRFSMKAAFHREFAACALDRGWLRLWILELDGRAAAVWYGFRYSDVEFAYQLGRDPALDSLSVGWVLFVHTVKEALKDGVHSHRLLRGGEGYKNRWANEDRGIETIAVARGIAGKAALGVAASMDKFRSLTAAMKKWAES